MEDKKLPQRLQSLDALRGFDMFFIMGGAGVFVALATLYPWKVANEYNRLSIPDKYLNEFKKNETIAFVVIKDSALWFEQYWEGYSNHSYSNPFSMTKSIVSLALGCAIDDSVIRNVDQPVSDFFPQFKGYKGTPLTIRHLLTMSAGVDLIDSNEAFASAPRLYYGSDLHQVVFSTKEIAEPGKRFIYQSGVTQLLAFLIEKATGENLASYVSRKLWTPMHEISDGKQLLVSLL